MERTFNGSILSELTCVPCVLGMIPDIKKKKCIMCPLSMPNCTCSVKNDDFFPGTGCYQKNIISSLPRTNEIYEITFNVGNIYSKLLYDNLLLGLYKCKVRISF